MRQWNYLQASFHPADTDQASGILWSLGTQGIEEDPLSPVRLRIKAYFDPAQEIRSIQRRFRLECQQTGVQLFSCSLRIQTERDWFKKWRQQLQPFPVGRRFHIIPSETPSAPADLKRIPIFLEPGMAFGTGSHETTQLCLKAIEQAIGPGDTCLDVGTGSGILAIAALKLGAKKCVACDIDPVAIEIAQSNGRINGCETGIHWHLGEIHQVPRFKPDVLVANLTIEIIEQAFQRLVARLKPGSRLILSGILNHQASRLEPLRRQHRLETTALRRQGEWSCLVYSRQHKSRRGS